MDTYTMTFVYDGELGKEILGSESNIEMFVLEMLQKRKFILADFNWSGCYDAENVISYLYAPYCCNMVMEIRLSLTINDMQSRETIYNSCLTALSDHQLVLEDALEYDEIQVNRLRMVFKFNRAA